MVQTLRSFPIGIEIEFLKLVAAVTQAMTPHRSLAPWAGLAALSGVAVGFIAEVVRY